MKRRLSLWGPPVLFLGLIFGLSALSRPLGPVGLGNWDKLAHFLEYAVLGGLFTRAIGGTWPGLGLYPLWVAGLIFTGLYGATDELHQAFVPGRDADLLDLLADVLGGALGAWLWTRWVASAAAPTPSDPAAEG